ncbi:hypothetical protein IWQ62_000197 [Dispira parvispora]|uniref:UBA domain-containing protein n=1 Tax=Dispira parvispora TaxID=1520584 RepID=A0A9W8AWH6_9FUNG|nr:hypothetical protein IWQ62_000197 [Dispira parvispora]
MRAAHISSIYRAIADVPFGVTLDFELPRTVSLPFDYIMDTTSVSAIPKYDFSLERKILDQIEERRTREQLQALTVAEQKRLTEEKLQALRAVSAHGLNSSGNLPKSAALGTASVTQRPISTSLTSAAMGPTERPGSVPPSASVAPMVAHDKSTSHLPAPQSQGDLSPPTSFSEVNNRPSSHIGNFASLVANSGNIHPGSPAPGGYPPSGSSLPTHHPRPPVATSAPLSSPGSASVAAVVSTASAMMPSSPQLYPPTTTTGASSISAYPAPYPPHSAGGPPAPHHHYSSSLHATPLASEPVRPTSNDYPTPHRPTSASPHLSYRPALPAKPADWRPGNQAPGSDPMPPPPSTSVAPPPPSAGGSQPPPLPPKSFKLSDYDYIQSAHANTLLPPASSTQQSPLDALPVPHTGTSTHGEGPSSAHPNPYPPTNQGPPPPTTTASTAMPYPADYMGLSHNPISPYHDDNDPNTVQQVRDLVDMGFSRTQAVHALEMFDYDLAKATNYLLDHP